MTKVSDKENKEQELQQKLMLYQLLQRQLEELQKQATMLQARFTEIEASRIALEDVDKVEKGNELLIPIGSGVYARGSAQKGDVLVDAGAGIMTEKSPAEALGIMETKKKELEVMGSKLQQEILSVAGKMNEIGVEMEKVLQEK
ncbi:MAG: prefoldin subunit alpha [Candidatus Aenigmarchaeota archaeon]|nr:prefoldin subunit alpha [Candidatus Aenigmarchaeota archaeon]